MVFGKGTSLSSKKNYKATQKRYVYKKGKRHTYYYVTSSKGVKGWVNSSLVKAGSYKKTTKTVTSKPKATTTNKPVKATKSVNPDKTYNATTLANDVIKELNDARAQITTIYAQPLIYDATLTQIGNERAKQLAADFSHNDSNGNAYVEAVAKKYGIWDTYYGTEDIGTSGFIGSNQQTADSIIKTVKTYEGHWADLTNGGYNKIGVGQYVTPERTMYLAIELGY
ncbi:CAP domain-containing protein [Lactiplantibacillus garii]|uniref:CAP domain-containing protein n=2 Tax=Lactiplantibacillus garii TaxID=2306423 RepID=A0A426D3Q5_9LACO|nr:CAP domain-containing protein [Lactiplantibacillus garii]